MRFAAVVAFAGAALATKGGEGDQYTTVTDVKTISSCPPDVHDCTWGHKSTTSPTDAWTKPTTTSDPWTKPDGSWDPPKSSPTSSGWHKPTGGEWGYNHTTLTTSTGWPKPTGGSWPTGTWDDCECEEEDTCTTAGDASPTGGWTGGNAPVGGGSGSGGWAGNGSVTTSSPTSIVTGAANAAAPAFLAVAAGLVAFLA